MSSRTGITLRADGFSVRCAAKQRYAVAVLNIPKGKLDVTKRTDAIPTLSAEVRRIFRERPNKAVYIFELRTGGLVRKFWPEDTAPVDDSLIARAISDATGRG